jgi:hypothetical protein
MAIEIEKEQAQGETRPARAIALSAKDEKDRFKAILLAVIENRDGQLFALIPPGKPREYPLRRKNGQDEIRDWALGEYIEAFSTNGRTANYEAARVAIWQELGAPAQDRETPAQDNQEKRGRERPKGKLSEEDETALYVIGQFKDWQENGPYPGSLFVRIPYLKDTRGLTLGEPAQLSARYTGLWYLPGQDKPPIQMIDAAFYYTDVTYPHASAKNRPYTGTLKAVNGRGQEKIFPFTGEELQDRKNNKFKSFAKWPQSIPVQARLLDAMEALLKSDLATVKHEQVDSLGYAETREHGLIYALANGIETPRVACGFIPNEKAPIVAPDLISAGNGYQGTEKKIKLSDNIWKLIFEGRNEEDQIRIVAKMGALMYTWFPPGTIEQAGRLPFYIETVGASSCGKTPEDNMIKSLQGVGFRYDSPPFLTLDDTKASAPARMQIMKHLGYSDDDRKSSPGAPGFQGEHSARKRHINYYADGQGAGSRYYDHATRIASRGEPQGLALGTSNYDHAIYALTTPDLDEDPIEYRACTFVVAPGHEIRTEENSRAIFDHKEEIYGMGRAARAWLMSEYNRDPIALREYIQDMGARARATMRDLFPYDWEETKQENHCRIFLWGALIWLDFLAKHGREQSYFSQKMTSLLAGIVEDRAIRSDYLNQMIKKRDGGADLGEFVLDAIRFTLANRRAYIIAQNGEPLILGELPPGYGLSSFGYFQHTSLGGLPNDPDYVWDHAHTPLGHYMKRSHTIAFTMNELYAGALVPYAREQKRELPRIDEIKKRLLDTGLLAIKQAKIKGRNNDYLVISLEKLDLPGCALVDTEEEDETRDLLAEADKVVGIAQARADSAVLPAPAPMQGELAMNDHAGRSTAPARPVELAPATNSDPFSFDPMA